MDSNEYKRHIFDKWGGIMERLADGAKPAVPAQSAPTPGDLECDLCWLPKGHSGHCDLGPKPIPPTSAPGRCSYLDQYGTTEMHELHCPVCNRQPESQPQQDAPPIPERNGIRCLP